MCFQFPMGGLTADALGAVLWEPIGLEGWACDVLPEVSMKHLAREVQQGYCLHDVSMKNSLKKALTKSSLLLTGTVGDLRETLLEDSMPARWDDSPRDGVEAS